MLRFEFDAAVIASWASGEKTVAGEDSPVLPLARASWVRRVAETFPSVEALAFIAREEATEALPCHT